MRKIVFNGLYQGMTPPQLIYDRLSFKSVILEPPDFNPGSWIGAGKALYDEASNNFVLTARPRTAEEKERGFSVNVYRSEDGENFELASKVHKEDISKTFDTEVKSIEGNQIIKDPQTQKWYLYVSIDTAPEFVWGGIYWQTLLLSSPNLEGPWKTEGLVLENDQSYDAHMARDATIDIVDGMWMCLYKARDDDHLLRPALAVSPDGKEWRKLGPLTVEGKESSIFLSGSITSSGLGPMFLGLERTEDVENPREDIEVVYADKYKMAHGGGPLRDFVAYVIDYRNRNLEPVFKEKWQPQSEYEHPQQPLLGYSSLCYDPIKERVLMYVEAIDKDIPNKMGLNETVERVILYESSMV